MAQFSVLVKQAAGQQQKKINSQHFCRAKKKILKKIPTFDTNKNVCSVCLAWVGKIFAC